MSEGPDPQQATLDMIERTNREINLLVEEVARLADREVPPAEFFGEFLKRVLMVLVAPAGAIWLRTPQGHLQLQFHINLPQIGLDQSQEGRQSHDELLREGIQQGRPGHFPPRWSGGSKEAGSPGPGNPTDYSILVAPVLTDRNVTGLVEVFQSPNRDPKAIRGFVQFLMRMADLVARYLRNHQLRQMMGQQQVWTQLENFSRQIHTSLNPTEVAYLVANEGRRLVECDRISVAVRQGSKVTIEAISGADVVEKRSNLVQLMRALCDSVFTWGERLVFTGTKDETLPPPVLKALDEFLAESHSKLLAVAPLADEREKEPERKPRSALVMECFEPSATTEQLLAQLEVVGRHAAPALYNAVEHRRIPMRFIWQPLAKIQEGLGGKTKAIIYSIGAALLVLALAMVFVPYPFKMEATGQLLPQERRWIYSPWAAHVVDFQEGVQESKQVSGNQNLILMYDVELEKRLIDLEKEILGDQAEIGELTKALQNANDPNQVINLSSQKKQKEVHRKGKQDELDALRERTHSLPGQPGYFYLSAPFSGTVLNSGFRENLTNRFVKPSDQLLRIGNKEGRWEIELKIPQKHIGQVLQAFQANKNKDLDVDVLLTTVPTRVFKGKLSRDKIAGEANPNRDANNESEPVVLAWVRIDGADISKGDLLPNELYLTGVEVHSKIRCGTRAMGYSLFYGVWEFFYEKFFSYF